MGVSTGLTLSSSFFLRRYYSANPALMKASSRKEYSKTELQYGDSQALSKAAAKLSSTTFKEEKNMDTMVSNIKAYVETYNNTLNTSSGDSSTKRYVGQLKALSEKYADELSDIGINVEKDGSLTVKDDFLKKADVEKVNKLFSKDSEFIRSSRRISKRVNETSYTQLYSQMTGTGLQVNISL